MKEKPILFSTPMVQALLENRKKMTRRTRGLEAINKEPDKYRYDGPDENGKLAFEKLLPDGSFSEVYIPVIPQYHIGDHIWVRESYRYAFHYGFTDEIVQYKAGGTNCHCQIVDMDQLIPASKWKPSIHMFKEDARIWLECTGVRCERLKNISCDDALAEGVIEIEKDEAYFDYSKENVGSYYTPRGSFFSLWDRINGEGSVETNPWVFIYEFKQIQHDNK